MNIFNNSAAPSLGQNGCQCIDVSSILESFVQSRGSCQIASNGQDGVLLTVEGPCVPYSYGSSSCLPHDMLHDPKCQEGWGNIPEYCSSPWCYVDAKSCMSSSSESVFRSVYFSDDAGVDVFYSYTTCNTTTTQGTDEYWSEFEDKPLLEGVHIDVVVPSTWQPCTYKRNPVDGVILPSDEDDIYYNNSIPWEGVNIDFFKQLMEISDGDLNMTFTFGSRVAKEAYADSAYTAAVKDVHDGLVDMSAGPMYVTSERLEMSPFTVAIAYEKTFLVIPKPGSNISLRTASARVMEPFTTEVWILLIVIICYISLLSVWFSDQSSWARHGYGKLGRKPKKRVYTRLLIDSCLQKGMYFSSAGVEGDSEASLSYRLLMFGFAFFILILVSAYVANLASFLTRNSYAFIGDMDTAIARGKEICILSSIEEELKSKWKGAKFVPGTDYHDLISFWDEGKCDFLGISDLEIVGDVDLANKLCERNLVSSDSMIVELALAFPARPDYVSGISYWIFVAAQHHGITWEDSLQKYNEFYKKVPVCAVSLSSSDASNDNEELAQIGVKNLLLPIVFLLSFSVMAIVVQLLHQRTARKNGTLQQKSFFGRNSTLSLELDSVALQNSTKSLGRNLSRRVSGLTIDQGVKEEDVIGVAEDSPSQDKGKGLSSSIAKGSIISADAVELDDEDNYERLRSVRNGQCPHRFQELVEEFDEFIVRYQDIKHMKCT